MNSQSNTKVSIITASFNSVKDIEKTIVSVLNQAYENLEFIIIDGGSTDGTIEIIKKYQDKISYWISEPDKGISDAFNKGLAVANGDYVNFQGSSDYLLNNNVIKLMMLSVNPNKNMLICGRIERVKESDNKEVVWTTPKKFTGKKSLLLKMSLPHQALFTSKKFFEKYGNFEIDFKFAMDYELLLRAYKDFPEVIMKDIVVSAWREGGIGTNRIPEVLTECLRAKKKNRIAPDWILYCIYLWSIFKYHVKMSLILVGIIKK